MKSIMGNGGEQSTLIAEDWGYLNPPFGKNIAIASSHMNMTWCNMTHAHATARRNPSLSTYTSPYIHIYLHVYYGFAHLPPCWEGCLFVCLLLLLLLGYGRGRRVRMERVRGNNVCAAFFFLTKNKANNNFITIF